jgi:hypothetical protein
MPSSFPGCWSQYPQVACPTPNTGDKSNARTSRAVISVAAASPARAATLPIVLVVDMAHPRDCVIRLYSPSRAKPTCNPPLCTPGSRRMATRSILSTPKPLPAWRRTVIRSRVPSMSSLSGITRSPSECCLTLICEWRRITVTKRGQPGTPALRMPSAK